MSWLQWENVWIMPTASTWMLRGRRNYARRRMPWGKWPWLWDAWLKRMFAKPCRNGRTPRKVLTVM
eukprot:7869553-Karenia_brevis.AAC.1